MFTRYDQSDLRPFKSAYKVGYVTVDNFIAELFFKRRSEFSKAALPQSFWNLPKYQHLYVMQLILINRLLERVSSAAIIKAFKQTNACSAANKELIALAEGIQAGFDSKQKIVEKTKEVRVEAPTKAFGKNNRLSEL